MLAFTLRRAIQAIGVMIAVGVIAFSMFRFAGDPVNQIVSLDTPAAEREAVRKSLGLDDPVPVQFARYFGNAMQFKFGVSYQFRQPVANLLMERMPATLELAICATILAIVFGILMGVYSALKRDTLLAKLFQTVSLIGISLPTFLIGILLIYLFSVVLGWLPSFGRGEVVRIGWWTTGLLTVSGLKALIMPSVTLGLFQMTLIMRLVRAEMLEVLRTDYIRFARARGLTTRAIHFGHALRNTLVPVITVAGLQFGSVIAFAIVTETVFQWPGMGLLFVQAVQNVDIPIMAAYLMLVALIFVTINLVVDILYTVVDPRLRSTLRQPASCPCSREPLHDRSAPPRSGRRPPEEGMTEGLQAVPVDAGAAPRPHAPGGRGTFLGRTLDSDVWVSFRRSKITMVAAAVTLLFFVLALAAGIVAPQNPFDPAELELMNSRLPPLWEAEGQA